MKKEDVALGNYYKCEFSDVIFKVVGWRDNSKSFINGDTPYVVNDFDKEWMCGQDRRTWRLDFLKPATERDIKDYKNKLFNIHTVNEHYCFSVKQDKDFGNYLSISRYDSDDFICIDNKAFEKMIEIFKKGYQEKY